MTARWWTTVVLLVVAALPLPIAGYFLFISANRHVGTYEGFGRLVAYPGKVEVDCPVQDKDTAVLLVAGQSNSANYGQEKMESRHPGHVFNYFDGNCYNASSPLLGATGEGGEFITLLADELVARGAYKTVVIVPAGIGDTPLSRWQSDGDLNDLLMATVEDLKGRYHITEVIWHQGENDYRNRTSARNYVKGFKSLLGSLDEGGVTAPVFIAIATKCGAYWAPDNPTARGQRELIDNKRIFLGADTDALIPPAERYDNCHFAEAGQIKAAAAYAESIAEQRRRTPH